MNKVQSYFFRGYQHFFNNVNLRDGAVYRFSLAVVEFSANAPVVLSYKSANNNNNNKNNKYNKNLKFSFRIARTFHVENAVDPGITGLCFANLKRVV